MKTLKCDLCDVSVSGEDFEAWMNALKPHYMQAHFDFIKSNMGTPEDMKAKMDDWIKVNKARFEAEAV